MAVATARGATFQTVTAKQIEAAANASHVPNFILAAVYKSGYVGDPNHLAGELAHWYSATGGMGWEHALAAYHAQSPRGVVDPQAEAYARHVMHVGTTLDSRLTGAMSVGSALSLAAIEAGAFLAAGVGAVAGASSEAAGAGAVAGGETAAGATAGGTAAKVAGGAAKVAESKVGKVIGAAGLIALITGGGLWKGIGLTLAGAVLVVLALRQVAPV